MQAKPYLSIDDTDDDTELERAIESASRMIDRFCGQRFWQDPSDTTRYFTPSHPWTLDLFETSGDLNAATFTAITSVDVDTVGDGTFNQTWTEDTHFFAAPRGAAASSRPFTSLKSLTGALRFWPVGVPDAVKIVGKFGRAAVPTDVEQACGIQTAILFKQATEGAAPIVTIDGTTLPSSKFLDRTVQLLLQDYVREMVG